MESKEFNKIFNEIISSLKSAGYDPHEQITGYLETGNEVYITRIGSAREKIQLLDKNELEKALENMKP